MLARVNGLFGWVEANERRSLLLFAGFMVALNVAAALSLFLPLAAFDADHAPVFGWSGYITRYVPIVSVAGIALFAAQLAWHVRSVQRMVAFSYVDNDDEPRLCGIVEPLAIQIGLPAPYVGVIETPALNAFACGTRRSHAVVVVTRGLIDGLNDDELAAVIAHELAHIANGDIRMLAAANACLRMIGWLVRPRIKKVSALQELAAFPLIMVVMPPLFLFVLAVGFVAQSALKSAHLVRLLIASSREFIADAAAVESTHNPAALVSALRRIDGRHHLPNLAPGCDAMMVAGATDGAFATHPTIESRVEAITTLTGSMAVVAPSGRDTRDPRLRDSQVQRTVRTAAPGSRSGALGRLGNIDNRNLLGLTPRMTLGALAALFVLAGVHRETWRDPMAALALLDPRPASGLMAVAARSGLCSAAMMAKTLGGSALPEGCSAASMDAFMSQQAANGGKVGNLLNAMIEPPKGMHKLSGGGFSNVPPMEVEAEQVRVNGCYRTTGYKPGDRGLHPVDGPPDRSGSFDLKRWLAKVEMLAGDAASAQSGSRDEALRAYVKQRRTITETAHHFFGEPGLDRALDSFKSAGQVEAVRLLASRLEDPAFAERLTPVEKAEMALLVSRPNNYLPCTAHRLRHASSAPP